MCAELILRWLIPVSHKHPFSIKSFENGLTVVYSKHFLKEMHSLYFIILYGYVCGVDLEMVDSSKSQTAI